MNILFLSIGRVSSINAHGIYTDLLRELMLAGNNVYSVCSNEKRNNEKTELINEGEFHNLRVRIGNITKCGMIEKGLSTLFISHHLTKAINHYFKNVKFDLILYSTPPITLCDTIKKIKKKYKSKTYLLLKDIFPQNAIDLGILKKSGIKGFIYSYFRKKEKQLYAISDKIGCMSKANVDYLLKNNSDISPLKVEIFPNCIKPQDFHLSNNERIKMRNKYGIPLDKTVFVYGGNLGKPQGIPFVIECLKTQIDNDKSFFLIVGDGTEYTKLENYKNESNQSNLCLLKRMPKDDFDRMLASCDIGMIFLDYRFTIPNFPSRLLSYMQAGLPVLACTDRNTDIGKVIVEGGFGWWCESNNSNNFMECISSIDYSVLLQMKEKARETLDDYYCVSKNIKVIFEEGYGFENE